MDKAHLSNVFGHDTEAGRMLAKLYGRPKAAPAPRPTRLRPMEGPQPDVLVSRPGVVDPRARTLDRAAIAEVDATKPSPVVVREVHVPEIDKIKGVIRSQRGIAEFEAARASTDVQQPPLKRGYNTDAEKKKIQAIFQLKGGRALPSAGLPEAIEGEIPLHLLQGRPAPLSRKQAEAAAAAAVRRANSSPLLDELERTFDAVKAGIEDSVSFIKEMRALRQATQQHEADHARTLADKTRELQRINEQITRERKRIAAAREEGKAAEARAAARREEAAAQEEREYGAEEEEEGEEQWGDRSYGNGGDGEDDYEAAAAAAPPSPRGRAGGASAHARAFAAPGKLSVSPMARGSGAGGPRAGMGRTGGVGRGGGL
jgi:hypothetical protein